MRGASARATRALIALCAAQSPNLAGEARRSISTISSATACVTIETTTRLDSADFLRRQKPPSPETKLLGFDKLGLSPWLGKAAKELGVLFPAEVHCAAIPEILRGKSLLLTSHSESVGSFSLGAFTYLLPLIQRLKRDIRLSPEVPKGPRAIILLSSKELAEEFHNLVKLILKNLILKPAVECNLSELSPPKDSLNSIGLFVSTPDEVLQKIEEGTVDPNLVKYLVLDEVDDMFNHGLGPDVQKLTSLLKEGALMSNQQGVQTILVTSMITKILRESRPSVVENLEDSNAEISGIVVELDERESFDIIESPDALRLKAEEVINSLQAAS